MPKNKGQTMHWLLRATAVCVGVIFVLFGGLFVAACLAMLGQGANAAAAAKVGTTVQIVTTVIFALVALAGMFLIWLGLRRGTVASACPKESVDSSVPLASVPPASIPHASPIGCDASPMRASEPCREVRAELHPIEVPHAAPFTIGERRPSDAELGQFIARCGPEKSGAMYNYISAGVYLLLALLCIIAPGRFIELKIDPVLAAKLALIPAGIGVAAAILHLWTPLFGAPQTIELYEHGIVERLGKQIRRIELATIERLRLQEWYEHRFAARTFNVKAQVHGQRQLAFNTALRGESERIIEYLASKIPQTEFVEFNATL